MGKDVGGEGNRRGEGSQISAGRAYTTEIDIEILGLDRPTIHQDVLPPTPAVQPYLVVSIEADSRAAANVSVNRKLLFTLAYGENAGAIEQQGWHEPTAIAAPFRVIKVPLVVCRQCRRFLLAGRAKGLLLAVPAYHPAPIQRRSSSPSCMTVCLRLRFRSLMKDARSHPPPIDRCP